MSEPTCERCGCPERHCVCEYAACFNCNGEGAHCGCWDDCMAGSCEGGAWCPDARWCEHCDGTGSVYLGEAGRPVPPKLTVIPGGAA